MGYEARSAVTKHDTFGGQRVAMRRDGTLSYLHGDNLGSASLATHASGGMISEIGPVTCTGPIRMEKRASAHRHGPPLYGPAR